MMTREFLLRTLKLAGLFRVARRLYRRNLLILCYHGFSIRDEYLYEPYLFMRPETFRERLRAISALRLPVLTLEQGLTSLEQGNLPSGAVVITCDDGWFGFCLHAAPMLREFGMPATVYVTSYYAEKRMPVFNVLLRYLFWRVPNAADRLRSFCETTHKEGFSAPAHIEDAMSYLLNLGERSTARERLLLARRVAGRLGIDWDEVINERLFELMTKEELRELAEQGFDIQLHSHRHLGMKTMDNELLFQEEIARNREFLSDVSDHPLVHYCYPSGFHHSRQHEWLRTQDIESAVTSVRGLNEPGCNPYTLKRVTDSDALSPLEFEAELCGVGQLLRQTRARIGRFKLHFSMKRTK